VKRELGIQFRPVDKAIADAAKSMMDRKLVSPKRASGVKKLVVLSALVGIAATYFVRQKLLI
jgi:hypothetical protein